MKTHLDWSDYQDAGMGDPYADIPRYGGDFGKAVAVCIRSGVCQETNDRGLMCPSFQASGNALLSPGGRVELLKSVLNQPNGFSQPASAELADAMAECVSCKGCRRECENNVDMARIKIEYLAQQDTANQPRSICWRNQLVASLPHWLHRYPAARGLISWRNQLPWLAWLGEKLLKIRSDIPLPQPAEQPFHKYDAYRIPPEHCDVVLLVDTFAHHFQPSLADNALSLLQRAGYRVAIAQPADEDREPDRPLCCGRTRLSQGQVAAARSEAQRMLAALSPYVDADCTVVGLEPSCLLTLRDEYLTLGLGEAAERLAASSLLLEEFVAREIKQGSWNLPLMLDERVQVSPHCHQRAFGALRSLRRVLKAIKGLEFNITDSSCCGMAGHYGFEAEHRSQSQAMATRSNARLDDDLPVISNGFSCRHHHAQSRGHTSTHITDLLLRAAKD